jgi:radical SAM protein with 4Fe4S-binding SPASM domain
MGDLTKQVRIRKELVKKYYSYLNRDIKVDTSAAVFSIETTNFCPMKCIMCPRTTKMTRGLGHMDFELFKRIVHQAKKFTHYVQLHHFGDPLMNPNQELYIDYCEKHGITTRMSINPLLLTEERSKKLLKSNLAELYISLDGGDDESYKAIRGQAADYAKAIENIKRFAQLKTEMGKKTPYVLIGMVLMGSTENNVENFEKMWDIPGVDERVIKKFSSFGANEDIAELGTTEGKEILFKEKPYPCYKPWKNFTVTWDGKVVPCCYDYDKLYVIGDLKEESLDQIWNNQRMQDLRRQHVTGDFGENTLCGECLERHGCPGFDQPAKLAAFMGKKLIKGDFDAIRKAD